LGKTLFLQLGSEKNKIFYHCDYKKFKGSSASSRWTFLILWIITNESLLARILELERSGGYQVDQQARYNLSLIPQYGGTVGGFRKELMVALGGATQRCWRKIPI
jgi:hypothetical protein